ncbi:helix-turn-helix domain-containing protein [Collimonas sp.]|jgi:hypothetical protein|uniref:helix-turn-helix domain-containing protein n=1 Tax=Collimonas sp. TaxID=1963772 RepID=UPI002C1E5C28|nr:helix-turn-helix domain-containing protein [Collimonas sp.]HWW06171.1 helix-turn-helix domain-containing protein [Collimonas sp.]
MISKKTKAAGLGSVAALKKALQPNYAPLAAEVQATTAESVILSILKSGNSLNQFEAERFRDHCLHSTISTLRAKGFLFRDEWEWVNSRFGKDVCVKRYSYIGS